MNEMLKYCLILHIEQVQMLVYNKDTIQAIIMSLIVIARSFCILIYVNYNMYAISGGNE